MVPSLDLLKKYTPQFKYGIISDSEIKEIVEDICSRNTNDIILGIGYDETDIRNGLVISKKYGVIIGAEDILASKEVVEKYINQNLGKVIGDQNVQLFLFDSAGTISIPVAFYALSKASNHVSFVSDKIEEIVKNEFKG